MGQNPREYPPIADIPKAERYARNGILTDEHQKRLGQTTIAVVGLGGLGGYVAEQLARLGAGHLVLIDGDVFQSSNLNRQLFATEEALGRPKSEVAAQRLKAIHSDHALTLTPRQAYLTEANSTDLLAGCHLVMDCLDSNSSRRTLLKSCQQLELPLVHGAIAGWYGQVATELPGDGTLESLLRGQSDKGIEQHLGNPAFTPGLIASLQVAEAIKWVTGQGELIRYGFLHCDLHTMDFERCNLIHEKEKNSF